MPELGAFNMFKRAVVFPVHCYVVVLLVRMVIEGPNHPSRILEASTLKAEVAANRVSRPVSTCGMRPCPDSRARSRRYNRNLVMSQCLARCRADGGRAQRYWAAKPDASWGTHVVRSVKVHTAVSDCDWLAVIESIKVRPVLHDISMGWLVLGGFWAWRPLCAQNLVIFESDWLRLQILQACLPAPADQFTFQQIFAEQKETFLTADEVGIET